MYSLLEVTGGSLKEIFLSFIKFAKESFADFDYIFDTIDIILLTALFFVAVKFLKHRKAGALIAGIVVCLFVYAASIIFNINSIRYILAAVFDIGVIAVVILFQPEIRDILERMGSGSLKSFKMLSDPSSKNQAQYKIIDSICKAIQMLSVEKTGALIVIERTTQLDDVESTGTIINADISDSLLRNLFYDKAPLHDGAVIIDEGRVKAAACILPLPKRTPVDPALGTRHRAAVGLSEVSDAIIVIVSEETGVISVAKECELVRNFTYDSLRKYLYSELIGDYGNKKKK